jgi:hypothetical protein
MIESVKPKLQFSLFNLLLVVFICLTLFIGVTTWKIQNSCNPMIGDSDISICPPPPPPPPPPCLGIGISDCLKPPPPPPPPCLGIGISDCLKPPPPPPPRCLGIGISDCLGAVAGAATITGLGILGTPVLAVVAAGIGVWFLVKTTIKAISGS